MTNFEKSLLDGAIRELREQIERGIEYARVNLHEWDQSGIQSE